jgi:MFS transporter, SP family, arabinose:H+ symporter
MKDLWNSGFRKALVVGVLLAVFQQFSGINAIMNYAPEIFKDAGVSLQGALEQMLIVGIVNFIFTILAIWIVDKAGRKPMLWIGSLGLSICLTVIGFTFHLQKFEGTWLLLPILFYVAFFASTLGPVVWVIISEIFPNRMRGVATSIVIFFLWVSNYLNIQLYPVAENVLGIDVTFWTYGAIMFLLMVFVLIFLPETKNKSLEEIEKGWLLSK